MPNENLENVKPSRSEGPWRLVVIIVLVVVVVTVAVEVTTATEVVVQYTHIKNDIKAKDQTQHNGFII